MYYSNHFWLLGYLFLDAEFMLFTDSGETRTDVGVFTILLQLNGRSRQRQGRQGRKRNAVAATDLPLSGRAVAFPARVAATRAAKAKIKTCRNFCSRCGNAGRKINKIAAVWTLSAMPLPQRGQQPISVRDINAKVPRFVIFFTPGNYSMVEIWRTILRILMILNLHTIFHSLQLANIWIDWIDFIVVLLA